MSRPPAGLFSNGSKGARSPVSKRWRWPERTLIGPGFPQNRDFRDLAGKFSTRPRPFAQPVIRDFAWLGWPKSRMFLILHLFPRRSRRSEQQKNREITGR